MRNLKLLFMPCLFCLISIGARAIDPVQNITLSEAGDLKYYISDADAPNVQKLTISGPLNGDDMKIIRTMCTTGSLAILNMSNATMVSGGASLGTYTYYYDNGSKQLERRTYNNVIADALFNGCVKLESMTLPNSITRIGYRAFVGCSKLASVNIGNGCANIDEEAFFNCSSLKSITIPSSL